jgi:predicted MFS family arabinose efflux permease
MASTTVQEWRAGWPIVLGAALAFATGYGTQAFISSMFIPPLEEAFGWSRGQIALGHNAVLAGAFVSPLVGRLIDRRGVRIVASVGAILLGVTWIGFALMPPSLIVFYLCYLVLAVVGVATTSMVYCRAVTTWFDASRGRALAFVNAGMTITGMLLPTLLFGVIDAIGWRAGYALMAALAFFVALPATWLLVRERPVALGQSVEEKGDRDSLRYVLGNWRAILLCIAGALTYAPFAGVVSQLQPLLIDASLPPASAAQLIGLIAGAALVGTILAGLLVDRIWAPIVAFAFSLGPVFGCILLTANRLDPTTAAIAIALLGMAQGAEVQLIAYLIGRYFPMQRYGTVFGVSLGLTIAMCSLSVSMFGLAHDAFGNYTLVLWIAAASFAIASVSYLMLGRYPAKAEQPA